MSYDQADTLPISGLDLWEAVQGGAIIFSTWKSRWLWQKPRRLYVMRLKSGQSYLVQGSAWSACLWYGRGMLRRRFLPSIPAQFVYECEFRGD